MPTIKGSVTAASDDALANTNLRKIPPPGAIVSLSAVGQTATDRIRLLLGQTEIMPSAQPNLETDADTGPDISKDVMVSQEVVDPGELVLPIVACGAQINYQLNIQYL